MDKIFTRSDLAGLSEIIWSLGPAGISRSEFVELLRKLSELLGADFAASYVWSEACKRSTDGIAWNIPETAMKMHETTWQNIDPLTPLLRQRQRPTLTAEVMDRRSLEKSDFYHQFLRPNGLHHGINVYYVSEGVDVRDLRIWRAKGEPEFGNREKQILMVLEPYFIRALGVKSAAIQCLTVREREVAQLASRGLTDKEIARQLGIGFTTVRSHLNQALSKLNCMNRTELSASIRN
ncbi:helix-turn-helix domain-containing protein [Pantoea anthophila]|uniref:LuxR family transcriptional regulator n=1 Tax=Pantoea anthophila TaxID=470931 RepID=A0ABY2Z6U1_9GAMM|nr:helix-turn-helix transcriptional regulator [Pantoea anthophila]TPV23637.1 LuxR family transcriptional regulator [Pantoea anthophila]